MPQADTPTGKEIAKRVYERRAPRYVGYEFVRAKGQGGKLSSSAGGVITVSDCLEVYQPEVLRWLFTRVVPRSTLQISFDEDVIQAYEEFDRAVLAARKAPPGDNSPKGVARRGIELSCLDDGAALLHSNYLAPAFRGITTVLQAFDGDQERTLAHFEAEGLEAQERTWLQERVACAWRWVQAYAPEEFRFLIRREPVRRELTPPQRTALEQLVITLSGAESGEAALVNTLKNVAKLPELNVREFFPVTYDLLIAKRKGPKLSTLLASIEPQRALSLLHPSLDSSGEE